MGLGGSELCGVVVTGAAVIFADEEVERVLGTVKVMSYGVVGLLLLNERLVEALREWERL